MALPGYALAEEPAAPPRVLLYLYGDHGESFVPHGASYQLDGKVMVSRLNDGLDDLSEAPMWTGTVAEGPHEVRVTAIYEGKSSLFNYVNGFRFVFRGRVKFEARAGQSLGIQATVREREGMFLSWEQRPFLRLQASPRELVREIVIESVEKVALSPGTPMCALELAKPPALGDR
jgi:hypothetical protein